MRDGIRVSRLMLIQNASDSISPPSPPSMRTRISHHRWRFPNTSAAVAACPEIRSGGSGRRWCGAPPRPGAFCRSPGRDRVPASPAQVGAGLRTPQGRERTPVPACKVADSELRRDAGVQVCEVAENASGLDPAAVGGESLSCTRRADRSQLLQVSQYRTRTGLTPASDDMPTTKDHLHRGHLRSAGRAKAASAKHTGLPAGARRSVSTSRWWARCSKSGVSRHSPSPSLTCAIRSPPRRVASQPITRDQPLRPPRSTFDPWTKSFRDHRDGRKRMTENAALVVGVDGSEGSRAALSWSAQEAHRRQLPLRIVAAAGLDAVMPATASESFWRHLSAHQESWANDVVNDAADLARQTAPVEPQTAVYLKETAVIALQGRPSRRVCSSSARADGALRLRRGLGRPQSC